MLVVMEMSSGKIIEDEFGSFEDEVLNAGGLPHVPEVQLGLQEVQTSRRSSASDIDPDTFLSRLYASQE
jgi:hypothetical protein